MRLGRRDLISHQWRGVRGQIVPMTRLPEPYANSLWELDTYYGLASLVVPQMHCGVFYGNRGARLCVWMAGTVQELTR